MFKKRVSKSTARKVDAFYLTKHSNSMDPPATKPIPPPRGIRSSQAISITQVNEDSGRQDGGIRSIARGPLNTNRHSMALREGFNLTTYSYDTDSFSNQGEDGSSNDNRKLVGVTREDRNNNKVFRNNLKNNLPNITIPTAEADYGRVSRGSPTQSRATPVPPSPASSTSPSTTTPSSSSPSFARVNRLTPTPPQVPASPLVLSPLPSATYTSITNPFSPSNSAPSINPLSVTIGKFATDIRNDNHSARVPGSLTGSVLSSRSATGQGVGITATRSEGAIDSNSMYSGGVTKDMLHSYRTNAPIRPSNAINFPAGQPLRSTSAAKNAPKHLSTSVDTLPMHDDSPPTNFKRNSSDSFAKTNHRRFDTASTHTNYTPSSSPSTPKSVMHNVELEFAYVTLNICEYK